MAQRFGVVVVAAGKGTRMGTTESKQYLLLQDKPVLVHTLEVFQAIEECESIVLVTGVQDHERCRSWIEQYGMTKVREVRAGGKERQDSVYEGLKAIESYGLDTVLIHDGVRPFVQQQHILACFEAALTQGAAVLAVPVKDTIKQVNEQGVITATPDRNSLWAIQTPQAFRLEVVMEGHRQAKQFERTSTDDAMLVEQMGVPVHVVEGDYTNVKLTTPEDLLWAEWWLARTSLSSL
ncbi:2-C-methyl-D-erythritol 4-phosphate cytidylyltransferase [Paenibacillus sp. 1001270B_150601_E10]|uniref:2-C-methyl-D-erythritol 4-phosphate cytidylyltransferase n=1 Tax=Paenibacillus sp. 1001270B_150601_E10 TaxID=2787079 RepID=UPI00189DC12F|nr:2-C-methyl-D-erythritol 4-phosphate cytidylyltransferase [Paenibacillus sp. 1001270B_150601_E10]